MRRSTPALDHGSALRRRVATPAGLPQPRLKDKLHPRRANWLAAREADWAESDLDAPRGRYFEGREASTRVRTGRILRRRKRS